jgi:hypothetical protein
MFASFIVRFLVYAIVLGISYGIAQNVWTQDNLDANVAFSQLHAAGTTVIFVAPVVLALLAAVARPVAIFVLFYIVGAMMTAPFALARFVG